tara:strand:- start:31 stop:717 length:687 start_codon:yes stop_codon:yes gene_type:complete
MKPYCLILARKRSQRIKKKNLISFDGYPLIFWTLKNAFEAKIFGKIILSSDWDELLSFSKFYFKDLILHKRKKNLSNSKASSEKVIINIIREYRLKKENYCVLLQPTSPLRKTDYIKDMWKVVKNKQLKTLYSVSEIRKKTYINKKNRFFGIQKKNLNNKKLFLNGSIYFFKTSYVLKNKTLKEKIGNYYFHQKKHSLDLDSFSDLRKFKCIYRYDKFKNLIVKTYRK